MQGLFLGLFLVITTCVTSHCAVANNDGSALSLDKTVILLDAKLSQLLQYHQGSVPELEQQVAEKIEEIVGLKSEILHAENTLKLVSDSAKQQELTLTKCQQQSEAQSAQFQTVIKHLECTSTGQEQTAHETCQSDLEKILRETNSKSTAQEAEIAELQSQIYNLTNENQRLQNKVVADTTELQGWTQNGDRCKLARETVNKYGKEQNLTEDKHIMNRACSSNKISVVKAFLDLWVSVDLPLGHSITCLHRAVANRDVELVKFLLDHGANIEARTEEHGTPLMVARYYKNQELIKLLVERGANQNGRR